MTFEYYGQRHVAEVAEVVTEDMKKKAVPKINLVSVKPEIKSEPGKERQKFLFNLI